MVNKMELLKFYYCRLCHILSLYISVLFILRTTESDFCTGEMSKYMLIFSFILKHELGQYMSLSAVFK